MAAKPRAERDGWFMPRGSNNTWSLRLNGKVVCTAWLDMGRNEYHVDAPVAGRFDHERLGSFPDIAAAQTFGNERFGR
jgi:hypothetical protein